MILQFHGQPLRMALDGAEPGILDGRAVADAVLAQLEPLVSQLALREARPTLAVVQVGADEASTVYVRHKIEACEQIGIRSHHHPLSEEATFHQVVERLQQLNADPMVHGVLLQLPLPEPMDGPTAIRSIDPNKDVDGFHPVNLGCLMTRMAHLEPCTPRGVLTLLRAADVQVEGKRAVVVGRSIIVGRPMAMMLTRANATVTLCHRHTRDLDEIVSEADILVVATGVAELVKGDWIKEEAVVIDVGISRKDGSLCGDVEFDAARPRARWITPVPGGVGPMTVATLLANTIRAACIQEECVIRDGRVVSVEEAGVHFRRTQPLAITRLADGSPAHRPIFDDLH